MLSGILIITLYSSCNIIIMSNKTDKTKFIRFCYYANCEPVFLFPNNMTVNITIYTISLFWCFPAQWTKPAAFGCSFHINTCEVEPFPIGALGCITPNHVIIQVTVICSHPTTTIQFVRRDSTCL